MTNRELGEALIREAERILNRDLEAAWRDGDYNYSQSTCGKRSGLTSGAASRTG